MISRIIETDADVVEGADWLAENVPEFKAALALTGPLPLRRRAGGFENLLNAIIGQQVSIASAQAIWGRMQAAGLTQEDAVLAVDDDALKACGLSRQKVLYTRALEESRVDYQGLVGMSDQAVIERLIKIKGIGRWTAEVYVMFSLGRADVFAPGDLALQEAAREVFGLPARPNEAALRKMALGWSPWQGVAARGLWAYYRLMKNREGIR